MRPLILRFPSVFSLAFLVVFPVALGAQQQSSTYSSRQLAHNSPDWPSIAAHLPNPDTAAASELEMQADILRARRFPEDALEFYNHALKRGGDAQRIYKKMGVAHLELRNAVLAQLYFQKAVKLDKKDAEAWNNLGAVEYLSHQFGPAISDYKRSVKLDGNSAIYHSNLGMAYFDQRDYKKARKEISYALKLDPLIFKKTSAAGVSAHVLSPEDRARFCLEMAKNYAEQGNEAEMLHSLSMAAEAGIDLTAEMAKDKLLSAYRNDPRVLILEQNAKALRARQVGTTEAGNVPPLKPIGSSLR
jgi:tetratricopeptide (TPR) repeat protein